MVHQAAQHRQPRQGVGKLELSNRPTRSRRALESHDRRHPPTRFCSRRPTLHRVVPRRLSPSGSLLCALAPCPRPIHSALRSGSTPSPPPLCSPRRRGDFLIRLSADRPLPARPLWLCVLAPSTLLSAVTRLVPWPGAYCRPDVLLCSCRRAKELSKIPLLGLNLKLILILNFQYPSS